MREMGLRAVSIWVDKLTHSIEDACTGERFETTVTGLSVENIREIKKSHWLFDWKAEILVPGREVYKLCCVNEPNVIQGLVGIEKREDHIYLHLVESAKSNRGRTKKYQGVPGNLFAYACKIAFETGFEGCVAFQSKTQLIHHYITSLGATRMYGHRLFIDTPAAKSLVIRYFGNEDD